MESPYQRRMHQDRRSQDRRQEQEMTQEESDRAKTLSVRLGQIVNLRIKTGQAITIATVMSFVMGGLAYLRAQPTAIPQVSAEWVDRVSEVVNNSPNGYLRLGIVEANQTSMMKHQEEQSKDIREIRSDIRAIREILERAK